MVFFFSLPVVISQFAITMLLDSDTWIPSVFGLSLGAVIWIPSAVPSCTLLNLRCIFWLSLNVTPFTDTLELWVIDTACLKKNSKIKDTKVMQNVDQTSFLGFLS